MPYGMQRFNRLTNKYGRNRALAYFTRRVKKSSKKRYGNKKSIALNTKKLPFSNCYGSSITIDRPLVGRGAFPATLFTQLRYTDTLQLSADNLTGRTGNEVAYRLNSLFDPYYAAGGHQPLGFDQLAAVYHNYTVYKVDVQVRIVDFNTAGGKTFVACNKRPSTSSYVLSGVKTGAEIQEQPTNVVLQGQVIQTWNDTMFIADVEGKPRSAVFTENSYTGSITADPVVTPYLSVVCGTWDEPSTANSWVRVALSFVFHARFSNQVGGLAQS